MGVVNGEKEGEKKRNQSLLEDEKTYLTITISN